MEGSRTDIHGGFVENIEARYTRGCFAVAPGNGVIETGNTCAAPTCDSIPGLPRDKPTMINLFTANDAVHGGVYGRDITFDNMKYYKPCPAHLGRLYFERRRGEMFTNGGPDITEIFDWTPRQEFQIEFEFDSCGLTPPPIDCKDFPEQLLGNKDIPFRLFGSCFPEEGLQRRT